MSHSHRPYISLVLPAYNEEENIEDAVAQAVPALERISERWELLIVNDASTDRTALLADRLAAAYPGRLRVLHYAHNHGLGGALRGGFAAAHGQILAYCDSDLPFDMSALVEAHDLLLREEVDLVAAYRFNREDEGLRRLVYSRVYNALIRTLFGLRVLDVNFSLKMFRREVLARAPLYSDGSFIDVELLARARAEGFRIAQFGVHYTPRVRGVSTLARPAVIVDILRELALYRVGRLQTDAPALAPPPDRVVAPKPTVEAAAAS